MDEQPKVILKDLIDKYGASLMDNPRRCEALLRDLCGEHKREIFVLISTIQEKVPTALLQPSQLLPPQQTYERLAAKLEDDIALSPDASRWAISVWTYVLGLEEPKWHPHPSMPTGVSTHSTQAHSNNVVPPGGKQSRGVRGLTLTTGTAVAAIFIGLVAYGVFGHKSSQQPSTIVTKLQPSPTAAPIPTTSGAGPAALGADQSADSTQPQAAPMKSGSPVVDTPSNTTPAQIGTSDADSATLSHAQLDLRVSKIVNAWISTTKSRDSQGHMALYGDPVSPFYTKSSLSKEEVAKVFDNLLESYSSFPVLEVSGIKWEEISPNLLRVDLDKHYLVHWKTGITVESLIHSQLTMRRTGNDLQIVGERDSKVYWKKTDDSEKKRMEAEQKAAAAPASIPHATQSAMERIGGPLLSEVYRTQQQQPQMPRDEATSQRTLKPPKLQPNDGGRAAYQARLQQLQTSEAEASYWRTVQPLDPYSLDAYLRRFPSGMHSAEARQQLQALRERDSQEAQNRRARGELFIPELGIAVKGLSPEQVIQLQRRMASGGWTRGWNEGWIGALEVMAVFRGRLPYGFEVQPGDIILSFGQKNQPAYVDPNGLIVVQDLANRVASLGSPKDASGTSILYTILSARSAQVVGGILVWDERMWALRH